MRGVIDSFTGSSGTVVFGPERREFDLSVWGGSVAPSAGMAVEVVVNEGKLLSLQPVAAAAQDGQQVERIIAGVKRVSRGVYDVVGKDVAIAYGAFAFVALFLPFFSVSGALSGELSFTLPDAPAILDRNRAMGGGGTIIWVLIAIVSIAVPYFWKHKYAPLALCVPLLVTLHGASYLLRFRSMMGELSELVPIHFGFGFYLCLAIACTIAYRGVTRFLRSRTDR